MTVRPSLKLEPRMEESQKTTTTKKQKKKTRGIRITKIAKENVNYFGNFLFISTNCSLGLTLHLRVRTAKFIGIPPYQEEFKK